MEFVKYIPGILLTLIVCAVVVWRWVKDIDYMHKNHPDYTGDDLFGFEPKRKTIDVKIKIKEIKNHKPKFNYED
jgi:hypothetical protein